MSRPWRSGRPLFFLCCSRFRLFQSVVQQLRETETMWHVASPREVCDNRTGWTS